MDNKSIVLACSAFMGHPFHSINFDGIKNIENYLLKVRVVNALLKTCQGQLVYTAQYDQSLMVLDYNVLCNPRPQVCLGRQKDILQRFFCPGVVLNH
jgi:hypothetical protein